MSAAAWPLILPRRAALSDLCRRTKFAGTCSSRCPSAQEMTEAAVWRRSTPAPFSSSRAWWRLPAARKGRILTLPEPARFYSAGRQVRQFGTANERLASLSDRRRVPQISGPCSSRSMSAQAMSEAAAWKRPTSRTLSSSRGWWRLQAAWNSLIYALHEPARFFLSGLGQARQFGTVNQAQRQDTKQHLYLVLDDRENMFSIHKLDIENDLDVGCISTETPLLLPEPTLDIQMRLPVQTFPEPPVLPIVTPTVAKNAQFAAIGSHIIAMSPFTNGKLEKSFRFITFNTKTALFNSSNVLPVGLQRGYDAAIAVSERLYFLESLTDTSSDFPGGVHCLAADAYDDEKWSWQSLSEGSPFFWGSIFKGLKKKQPKLPFDPKEITGHAVNLRTATIFVSAVGHERRGTFSYCMAGSGQWKKCRGNWVLPFKGAAHYDDVLGAWVGLHLNSVNTNDSDPQKEKIDYDGYLCACSVMSGPQQPNSKVGMQMLFLKHPYWSHVDTKLVYTGEGSKYCLVERLLPKGANKMKYVLRLTMFIVKYDEDGYLKIMADQRARFYKAPSYFTCFDMQAFWM